MNEAKAVVWPAVILMAVLGLLTLWLKQFIGARSASSPGMAPISAKEYWIGNWPSTLFALSSVFGGIAYLDYLGWLGGKLGPAIAWGVGYIGNSIADLLGGRVQAMISAAPLPGPEHVSRKTKEEIKEAVVEAVDSTVADVNKKGEG